MIQPDIAAFARDKAAKKTQTKMFDTSRDVQRDSMEKQYPKMVGQNLKALLYLDATYLASKSTYHHVATALNIGEPAASRVCNTLKRHGLIEASRDGNGNIIRYKGCSCYQTTAKGTKWLKEQGK
jgi:DNA-binding transcriptional ArsR family regulator